MPWAEKQIQHQLLTSYACSGRGRYGNAFIYTGMLNVELVHTSTRCMMLLFIFPMPAELKGGVLKGDISKNQCCL